MPPSARPPCPLKAVAAEGADRGCQARRRVQRQLLFDGARLDKIVSLFITTQRALIYGTVTSWFLPRYQRWYDKTEWDPSEDGEIPHES